MYDSPVASDSCKVFSANSNWYCYVSIPKVASSYLKLALPGHVFDIWNWQWYEKSGEVPSKQIVKYIIVLRDPIERWITGAVEYWHRIYPNRNWMTQDLHDIFAQIEFDKHTRPQSDFVHLVDLDRTIWLWMGLDIDISQWFINQGISLTFVPDHEKNIGRKRSKVYFDRRGNQVQKNMSDVIEGPDIQMIYNQLKSSIESNTLYQQQIKNFYKKDYNLIQSVRFDNL